LHSDRCEHLSDQLSEDWISIPPAYRSSAEALEQKRSVIFNSKACDNELGREFIKTLRQNYEIAAQKRNHEQASTHYSSTDFDGDSDAAWHHNFSYGVSRASTKHSSSQPMRARAVRAF